MMNSRQPASSIQDLVARINRLLDESLRVGKRRRPPYAICGKCGRRLGTLRIDEDAGAVVVEPRPSAATLEEFWKMGEGDVPPQHRLSCRCGAGYSLRVENDIRRLQALVRVLERGDVDLVLGADDVYDAHLNRSSAAR